MAFLAGKSGSVTVAAATWKLQEWSLEMSANLLDVTTFAASGYRVKLAGLLSARVTLRGPYDGGSMALTCGSEVALVLSVGGGISFSVTVLVGQITPSTSVEGVAQINVTAESTGSFTAAIT